MITEKDMYRLERELQDWHRRPKANPDHLSRPDSPGQAGVLLRAFWSHMARVVAGTPAASTVQPGTPPALELLRAVARGDISPESANQQLISSGVRPAR